VALQPACNGEDAGRRASAMRCKVAAGGAEEGLRMSTDMQTFDNLLAELGSARVR
jgi:hypothetical protein